MINIKINNKDLDVKPGATLLQAAKSLGITIPTMCYDENLTHFTSCMLCVVKDVKSGKMLPACSYTAQSGMSIETDSAEVIKARQYALELLMSEHVGDCEGPCVKTCPANMNIPLMLKQIESNDLKDAIITIKNHIPLPAILGRICPAPCEKGCRRSQVDEAVSICKLKGYVGEWDLKRSKSYLPEKLPKTNKKIAIIGSGPTGLSTAWYLLQYGHSCTIYDKHPEAGGMLRYGDLDKELPQQILDNEIQLIKDLGAEIILNTKISENISPKSIMKKFNAVVIASGSNNSGLFKLFDLDESSKGVNVNKHTFQTNIDKIFAGGGAIGKTKMAVKSVGHGRHIAISINQYIMENKIDNFTNRFNSRIGKIMDIEKQNYLMEQKSIRFKTEIENITLKESTIESARCLHCECLKPDNCKLRDYSDEYDAKQSHFKGEDRTQILKNRDHHSIIYESGKCIKCGLCVRLTEKSKEKLGLTFIGRGFDVKIGVPLNKSLENGLIETAEKCVEICPTGALAVKPKKTNDQLKINF